MKRAILLAIVVAVFVAGALAIDVAWEHRARVCIAASREDTGLRLTKLVERSSGRDCGMLFRRNNGLWTASALPESWLGNHNATARWMPIIDNQDFQSREEALLALSKYCAVDNKGMDVR